MRSIRYAIILTIALGTLLVAPALRAQVRAWEGTLQLPTYLLGEEDANPPFPLANRHNVYPYTMLDDLTDRREARAYRAAFLENEYLKAIVLPEMGGRLYSLYDKVTKREVLYRNNVVKYGLVALRGAWISGGIEWNFPNGHTVVTVSPVSSVLRRNPDGSATVVVGDVDLVTGMHWEVALTLRPGQARLEQHVTLFNTTPLTNLYWFWATTAVPATDDMQFIYPMREAYPHTKGVVWSYPVHDGKEWSWYKNVREPTSLFARQVHRTFFGAYYHKSDYGVAHVADFREVPGKKTWTWGVADDGLIWTDLLTDKDGAYNEIQAGRYETQLNYEFMPPRRVESFTEYWYPVRGLGDGFVEATDQLALNVRFLPAAGGNKPRVELLVSPAVAISSPRVRVLLGSELLREFQAASFAPLKAIKFSATVEDLEAAKKNLAVEIRPSGGQTLLRWSAAEPVDGNLDFVPAAGARRPPGKSLDKMTVEELFLYGIEQEKDGEDDAAAETFRQVLERDPGYLLALVKLAWRAYRAGDFPRGEGFITRALVRDQFDPVVHYAAGVIYRASGRLTLAADAHWTVIRYGGPPAPPFAQLGEIAIRQKRYDQAVDLLRQALSYNPKDALVEADLATALRLAGKKDEAWTTVNRALEKMPLLPWALAERWRIAGTRTAEASAGAGVPTSWARSLRPDAQTYLDVAAWYRGLDDLASSDAVLRSALKDLPARSVSPLVFYYLASNARRQAKDQEASEYAAKAASATYEKVFPHRVEDALVLQEAVSESPLDSHAQYFLGNFLFARGRYEEASQAWLQALGGGFEYAVLARNLGLYAWRVKKDLADAAGFYERAIQLAPNDYRLYVDLDEIYAQLGDSGRRVKLFSQAPAGVLGRDTVRVRRALLLLQQKQYDQAFEILSGHDFKPWEGGAVVRQVYVAANLETGRANLTAGNFREAEEAFRRATEYPVNLGVGKPNEPHDEAAFYWLGEALQAAGKAEAARAMWQEAAGDGEKKRGVSRVFQATALRRLGQTEEGEKILNELLEAAKEKAGAHDHYVAGLVERFRDREESARESFRRALEMDPTFWPARLELERNR
jgi:tetratricopeptide (TPR) repeat protein